MNQHLSSVLETPPLLAQSGAKRALTVLDLVQAGGVIGYIIVGLSFLAVVLIFVHFVRIRRSALAPQATVDELDSLLSRGEVEGALAACDRPENACFLSTIMAAGLSRYRRSPFGALELKGALEEAGQEQMSRLYRSTDGLAMIATVSPMLGLLGTVVGLNGAFATISATEGFARPDQLAGDVSLALVTTIQGLIVAIPLTAVVTFFRNRVDSLAGDVASIIDDLALHLEEGPAATAPARSPAASGNNP